MTYVKVLPMFLFALLLALVSLPWLALAIGFEMTGEHGRYEALLDACPLSWWFDRLYAA